MISAWGPPCSRNPSRAVPPPIVNFSLFCHFPVAVSAIARQRVLTVCVPPPWRPDIQDRRHRTESARIQHPGRLWPRLSVIPDQLLFTTRFHRSRHP